MKRFMAMNLYHAKETEVVDMPWIDVKEGYTDSLPNKACKVLVKTKNNTEDFAYFFPDKCAFSFPVLEDNSHFWHCEKQTPISKVVSYKWVKEPD